MPNIDDAALAAFLERHARALNWILRDAGGAWTREDLLPEAVCALLELHAATHAALDPASDDGAGRLLARMRRRARKAGGGIRSTLHPDQALSGEDWSPRNVGWNQFVADEGEHPALLLEAFESAAPEPEISNVYHSPAAGWACVLRRFDNRMAAVADFLLISSSWCGRCYRRALWLAQTQSPLPDLRNEGDPGDALGPWRSFRLSTRASAEPPDEQPWLDFWSRPRDPALGQMWLL